QRLRKKKGRERRADCGRAGFREGTVQRQGEARISPCGPLASWPEGSRRHILRRAEERIRRPGTCRTISDRVRVRDVSAVHRWAAHSRDTTPCLKVIGFLGHEATCITCFTIERRRRAGGFFARERTRKTRSLDHSPRTR